MVELLVALTAGLLVSSAAYLLARNSMKSYQDESRIATSQVSASIALNRMQAELQRAGYMSSANTAADPGLCGARPTNPIQALRIFPKGSTVPGSLGYDSGINALISTPDLIVVSGNMTSTEQLEYRVITDVGGDMTVYLAMERGPMQRLAESLGQNAAAVEQVFRPVDPDDNPMPRVARIVDASGKASYVLVTEAVATGGPPLTSVTLTITKLDGTTPSNTSTQCGFVDRGGGLINPVSIVRYRIGSPAAGPYDMAVAPVGEVAVTGEDVRTELLREELEATSNAAALVNSTLTVGAGLISQEILAEFAVALEVSAYVWDPATRTVSFQDFSADTTLDDIPGQNFRAIGLRVATRARVPDREETGPAGVVTRFALPLPNGARQNFARMRSLQTQIQLPNLAGVTW